MNGNIEDVAHSVRFEAASLKDLVQRLVAALKRFVLLPACCCACVGIGHSSGSFLVGFSLLWHPSAARVRVAPLMLQLLPQVAGGTVLALPRARATHSV